MSSFNSKEKFLLFVCGVMLVSFFIITFTWSANSYYADAYRQPIQQSKEMREKIDRIAPVSKQPARRGVSESDIDKSEGRRYRAF